jgi:hypothetical protein
MTKEVLYQGLSELPVSIEDTSRNSLSYFRINSLPTDLTAGKNLFSFSGNPYTFVEGSPLYVEVVDSTGTPIYTEVSINAESDDQYAIVSIFIDNTTAPGSGEIILCGTVDTDANGNSIDTSRGVNIRWSTPIQIYPSKRNTSNIVFSKLPTVSVSASKQNYVDYFYPGNGNRFTSSLYSGLNYLLYNNSPVLLTSSLSTAFRSDIISGTIYISSSNIQNLIPNTTNIVTVLSESIASVINSGSIVLANPLQILQNNSNAINEFKSATITSASIVYEQRPNSSSLSSNYYNLITVNFSELEPTAGTISRIKSYYKQISVGEYVLFNESDISSFESIYGYTTSSLTLRLPLYDIIQDSDTDFKFEFINPDGTPSNQVVVSKNHLTYNTANTGSISCVTQIIAGTNVILSPEGGTGIVTVNAVLASTGSGVPNGPLYSLQYNNGGLFSGSGNFTFLNNNTLYLTGSLNITGSTTQRGNNTLIGITTLTGSILINGNVVPQISSSFDLGSITNPWRALYVQSGSISIQSDIPGGPPAVISNANGNVSITAAGLQLKSGSVIPFDIEPTGRTIIRVPNIPANDVGGFSIIGSSDGAYQPVTNNGGMVHITGNENASTRLNLDNFGNGGTFNAFTARAGRGTASNPSQSLAGDVILRIGAVSWKSGSGFTGAAVANTTLDVITLENATSASHASAFQFYTAGVNRAYTRYLSTQIDAMGITIPSSSRFFGTASWASNVLSSSFASTASYVVTAQTASYVLNAVSSSFAVSSSRSVSSSFATSSSFALTASLAPLYVLTSTTSSMLTPYLLIANTSSMLLPYLLTSRTSSFATTGSNTFHGNQIITGSTNITGSLSLSAGSALNINDGFFVNGNKQFNYGQFSSTVTQSGSANTAYSMTFDTTDFQVGVVLSPFPNNSRITVVNTGIYNIQFSTQLHTTANQFVDFSIWFAKNGLDIANSNTDFTIEKINGGGFLVAALNFLVQLQSNDYIELKYSKTTNQGQLQAKGPQINPIRPGTPSAIITVTQIA